MPIKKKNPRTMTGAICKKFSILNIKNKTGRNPPAIAAQKITFKCNPTKSEVF